MSEVKRWSCQVYSGVPEAHSCGEIINLDEIDVEFVKAEDYDALREDLRCARHGQNMILSANGMLSERLADAERRNAELVGLLRSVWECSEVKGDEWKRIDFYLNPNPEAASHE